MILWRLSVVAAALAFVAVGDAPGDDLPPDAQKRIEQFEMEADEIRKKAEADTNERCLKLIEALQTLQDAYTKDGKLDEAVAIRERIRKLKKLVGVTVGKNMLVNGSFEEGPEVGDKEYVTLKQGNTAITGWKVTKGSIDYQNVYWEHADGKHSLDLNGLEPGAIAQTFKTKKGEQYRVTFSLAGNPNPGERPLVKKLSVRAADSSADFECDATGKTYKAMGWETKTWDFVATADETTLEFVSTSGRGCGAAIDNVAVHVLGEAPKPKPSKID